MINTLAKTSYAELPAAVTFERDEFEMRAVFDDAVVGGVNLRMIPLGNHELEIADWKLKVFKAMAARCATIILATACGARRVVDYGGLQISSSRTFLVPLRFIDVAYYKKAEVSTFVAPKDRAFRFRSRFDPETGLRVFDEVVP